MNKKHFVNIIILNWNNYDDTVECINSIEKINYPYWGVTIIDNHSTDGSIEKLKKEYKKKKKIRFWINKKNEGFAKGNNIGMRKDFFNADLFLLLNNDTVVEKNFLKKLVEAKKELIAPLVYNYYSKKELSKKDFPGKFNFFLGGGKKIKLDKSPLQRVDYASGSCWLIKKELFQKTGGFNENYFAYNEEIEWAYRLKEKGYKFYLSNQAKIWHKVARTSKNLSGLRLKLMNRNIIWFERKYSPKEKYLFFVLYFFIYKMPKDIFKIILSRKDMFKKIKCTIQGIKEGFLGNIVQNEK